MFSNFRRNLIRIWYSRILRNNVKCARKLGVRIGDRCRVLDEAGSVFGTEPWLIQIGDHVEITNGVRFLSHEGALWCLRELDSELKNADLFRPTVVGNNVMIGMRSLIMPGVHIGNNVIIGAQAVVTKDIPDNTIVAGVPAKPISTLEEFKEKMKNTKQIICIKNLSQSKKYKAIKKIHPEWF